MPETSFTSFTLGKYRAVELLGKGGFGTVYRAVDTTLDREVALKVLHPQLVADPTFVERFRTEAKIIAALRHPNVVGVYELGEEGGRLFIAMEYMPGGTLKERLAQRGRLSFAETLTIMQQVCAGLDAAHAEGMLHRDIKPGNILFDKRGNAVIGDFGLARAMQLSSIASASSSSSSVGTPFYKAPELWRGNPPASPATDVYALTCMVYEMLTGRVLFSGDTPDEVLTKHLIDGPDFGTGWPPADAPQGLTEVIQRSLARNPEERYATAKALADALLNLRTQAAQRREVVALPASALHVATPTKQSEQFIQQRKSKSPVWGLVVTGLVVVVMIGVMLGQAGNNGNPVAVAPTQIAAVSLANKVTPSETPSLIPTMKLINSPTRTPIDTPTSTSTPKPSSTPAVPATPQPSKTQTPMPTTTSVPPAKNDFRNFRVIENRPDHLSAAVDYTYVGDHTGGDISIWFGPSTTPEYPAGLNTGGLDLTKNVLSKDKNLSGQVVYGTAYPVLDMSSTGTFVTDAIKMCMYANREPFYCESFAYKKTWQR